MIYAGIDVAKISMIALSRIQMVKCSFKHLPFKQPMGLMNSIKRLQPLPMI